MFFARLPAGYLLTSALGGSRRVRHGISSHAFMAAGLAGRQAFTLFAVPAKAIRIGVNDNV